jgi:hypothetical protein
MNDTMVILERTEADFFGVVVVSSEPAAAADTNANADADVDADADVTRVSSLILALVSSHLAFL